MSKSGRVIQSLILLSTLLGGFFLWEVNGLLPSLVFDFLAFGWVLFLLDSVLTFVRPVASFYLGLVLAILALSSSLPQSAHYALIENGQLVPAATFVIGSAAQVLIIALVLYHIVRDRKREEWAWPGAKSAA